MGGDFFSAARQVLQRYTRVGQRWDGMGAVIKGRVTRDIVNGRILNKSGLMESSKDVAEHLEAYCVSE